MVHFIINDILHVTLVEHTLSTLIFVRKMPGSKNPLKVQVLTQKVKVCPPMLQWLSFNMVLRIYKGRTPTIPTI